MITAYLSEYNKTSGSFCCCCWCAELRGSRHKIGKSDIAPCYCTFIVQETKDLFRWLENTRTRITFIERSTSMHTATPQQRPGTNAPQDPRKYWNDFFIMESQLLIRTTSHRQAIASERRIQVESFCYLGSMKAGKPINDPFIRYGIKTLWPKKKKVYFVCSQNKPCKSIFKYIFHSHTHTPHIFIVPNIFSVGFASEPNPPRIHNIDRTASSPPIRRPPPPHPRFQWALI